MSVFKLPKRLCIELNMMLAKFWWGNNQKTNCVHWCSWEKMRDQKDRGGLGFRDFDCFNLALLAKQGWRLIQNPRSMVAMIFREKYFRSSSFLEAKLGHCPSLIWRSIWNATELLRKGLRWRVGNEKNIKIWGQKWIPSSSTLSI